ncbi:MAG TPA: LytTR family DNA-binding domain-containing protein, partial [Draconibacterium sp.]|nr:LytTR family DNA-binding domain-containing protein [Draconibacterium sp.]
KSIIIDDEKHAIELLDVLLRNIPEVLVKKTFTSPAQAFQHISNNETNLIFLDIQMPEISGIDFVRKLSELNLKPYVIFVTAHDKYMLEALRLNAIDFLLKPVDVIELEEAILRIKKRSKEDFSESLKKFLESNHRRKLRFNTRNGFVTFFEDEILFIKADGVYSMIHLVNGKEIIISQNLGKIEEQLQKKELIKIHRSTIANVNYIFEINRSRKECILAVDSNNYILHFSTEGLKLIESIIDY